jgi:2-iminoacetate synthase ThiH
MLTRQQAVDLWRGDALIALGFEADAVRKRLHPDNVVTYTLAVADPVVERLFACEDPIEKRLDTLDELRQPDILVFRPLVEATATGMEYMKILALSRVYLDQVPHIQGTWKPFGLKVAQLSLRFGANDLGFVEGEVSEEELRRLIRDAGFVPKQRDALFRTYSIA